MNTPKKNTSITNAHSFSRQIKVSKSSIYQKRNKGSHVYPMS